MKYKNIPQDLSIKYKVQIYNKLEELFDVKDGEMPSFHFMLALMGYQNHNKIELNKEEEGKGDRTRDFSLRTVYPRNESDLDTYYGLLAILDNLDKPYEEVIEKIAFERTENNGNPFLKMKNVQTFYEYMLGGLDYIENTFLNDGFDEYIVVVNIHEFLMKDDKDINDILLELIGDEDLEL